MDHVVTQGESLWLCAALSFVESDRTTRFIARPNADDSRRYAIFSSKSNAILARLVESWGCLFERRLRIIREHRK